jgi:hypothetical protein
VWVLAAALSGCLVSEEPLISEADSQTPLEDGAYRYAYVQDDTEQDVVLSSSGGVTTMVAVDDVSSKTEMRMAKLRRGYFVMMSKDDDDSAYLYWLMRVDRGRATLYSPDDNCSRLKELWLVDEKTPADVGIAAIEEGFVATCAFTRYRDVARAFRDLLADGRLVPMAVIEPK